MPETGTGRANESSRLQREARYREALADLHKKTEVLSFLFTQSERIDPDEPDMRTRIEEIWSQAIRLLDPDIAAQIPRYLDLKKRRASQYAEEISKLAALSDEEFEAYQDAQYFIEEAPDDEKEALDAEIAAFNDDRNFFEFVERTHECITNLLEKHETLKTITTNPKDLVKILKERLGKKIDPKKITKVVKGPFSLSVIIEPTEYVRVFGEATGGLHYRGTPFNVIKAGTPATEEATIHHENIHNLTDYAVKIKRPALEFMKNVGEFAQDSAFTHIFSNHDNSTPHFYLNAETYLDHLHGEIVAHLERLEKKIVFPDSDDLISWTDHFSTAGVYAEAFVKKLEELEKNPDECGISAADLQKLKHDFSIGFVKIAKQIRLYLLAGRALDGTAHDELESLFFILTPTKYRHIAAYLDQQHGPELLENARVIERTDYLFELDQMKEMVSVIQKPTFQTGIFYEELRTALTNQIHQLDGALLGATQNAGMSTIQEMREYYQCALVICEFCGERESYLPKHIRYAFMDDFLKSELPNKFAGLPEFCASLTTEEKDKLQEAVEIWMDYALEDLELDSMEDLKKTPHWSVLTSLGLTKGLG